MVSRSVHRGSESEIRAGFTRASRAFDMEQESKNSQADVASLGSAGITASLDEPIACNGCKNKLPNGRYPFRMSKHPNKSLWNYCDTVSPNGKSCLDKAKHERAAAMNAGNTTLKFFFIFYTSFSSSLFPLSRSRK